MQFPNPALLLHPQIPKPLHEVNPRNIMGKEWWDKVRKEAYAENQFCCWACGQHKSQDPYHKWLEAHEDYDINYKKGRVTIKGIVALCHSCHNFIHSGRLLVTTIKREDDANPKKFWDVMYRGFMVLKKAGLPPNWSSLDACWSMIEHVRDMSNAAGNGFYIPAWAESPQFTDALENTPQPTDKDAEWEDWRLVFDGKEYPPKYPTPIDWLERFAPEVLAVRVHEHLEQLMGLDQILDPYMDPYE